MNQQIATSFQRKAKFVLACCLLLGVLGALASGYTQKAQSPLTQQDAVIEEDERTLRAKEGFKFELSGKKIIVREVKTRRFVALSDGVCGGGCNACSALIDFDGTKVRCKGCNDNSACKRL